MRNRKLLPLIAWCIIGISISATAQHRADSTAARPYRTIFGELGGPGIFSINYDQRFKGSKGLGFRAGIGGIGILTTFILAAPIGLNYLLGANSHYLELGAGISFVTASDHNTSLFNRYNTGYVNYFIVGYRYQPSRGLSGRIFLSPLVSNHGQFAFWGGLSLGIKLRE
jgi:hypothetical protein